MILLDSNVIIDFWHKPTPVAMEVMSKQDVCICGPVLAELLHGARQEQELDEIQTLVAGLPQVEMSAEVWPELGRNLYALRKAGLAVPFQDALLATLAIANGLDVWTADSHFELMKQVLTGLKLFSPESAGDAEGGHA